MNRFQLLTLVSGLLVFFVSCQRERPVDREAEKPNDEAPLTPGRIAIPDPVRRNLGITFAKVEARPVSTTRRYPGRFEVLPEARKDYHAPTPGRLRLQIQELQEVLPGQVLFHLEAPRLRDLARLLAEAEAGAREAKAQIDGLPAFKEAHKSHETVLQEAVELWTARVRELDALAEAGGGRANDRAEARAALMAARVDLAETQEKDAELGSRERELRSRLQGAEERIALLHREIADLKSAFERTGNATTSASSASEILVRAEVQGRVAVLEPADGAWVEEGAHILQIVEPGRVRFRAAIPQGDWASIAGFTEARLSPLQESAGADSSLTARLRFLPEAQASTRTIDALAVPDEVRPWSQPGMVGYLEMTPKDAPRVLAIPKRSVLRDGAKFIFFRRDHRAPDFAIRTEADLGADDGKFVEVRTGLVDSDEVIVEGAYQLLLATSSTLQAGGHFHADGTFHVEDAEKGKD